MIHINYGILQLDYQYYIKSFLCCFVAYYPLLKCFNYPFVDKQTSQCYTQGVMEKYKVNDFKNFEKTKYYYQLTYGKTLLIKEHTHEFYEIILVLRDKVLHSFNGEKRWLFENNFIFISPDDRHCFLRQNKNSNVFVLSVEKERFEAFVASHQFTPVYGKSYIANSDRLIRNVNQLFENYDWTIQLLNAFLSDLFTYAVRDCISDNNKGIPCAIIEAVELMRKPENLAKGVSKFSEISGYSRSQLNRLINKHYNQTPHKFLLDIQMSIAKELIEHTNLSFEEISANVGFASTSRFYGVVKSYFGCTPKELRNKNKI